jgi:hypothetical protein
VPRLPFRIAFFLSSYAPLFGLLAFTNRDLTCAWIVLAAVAVGAPLVLGLVLWQLRDEHGPTLQAEHSSPKDGEVLAYIATYLVPFLSVDLGTVDETVVLCVFLVVLGVVYVNSEMLFVNPLLSFAGYRSFTVIDEDGHEYSVITRRKHLDPGQPIEPAQIGRYVRLEVRSGRR